MSPVLTSAEPRPADNGLNLSQEEVASLMGGDASATLVGITEKIAGAYGQQTFVETDAKAAEQIFRLLLRETEVQVRQTLAKHVKASSIIPHDIVLTLANDVAEVSLPVLQYSQVLTDDDLLELINRTKDNDRYLAIASRESVSESVSGSLLDKGDNAVAATLVQNSGANVSEAKLAEIVAKQSDNSALMQSLRNRPNLPSNIAEKLVHAVTKNLGDALKQKHVLPDQAFEQEVDKARETETLRLVRQSGSQEDIDRLIGQLISFNRLSPALILSALCQGNFQFFETSLARLSGIPVANARTLINDRGDLGFRAIYNKSGLPESLFQAVRVLLKTVQSLDDKGEKPGSKGYIDRVVESLLQNTAPVDNLSYIVALVRRAAA